LSRRWWLISCGVARAADSPSTGGPSGPPAPAAAAPVAASPGEQPRGTAASSTNRALCLTSTAAAPGQGRLRSLDSNGHLPQAPKARGVKIGGRLAGSAGRSGNSQGSPRRRGRQRRQIFRGEITLERAPGRCWLNPGLRSVWAWSARQPESLGPATVRSQPPHQPGSNNGLPEAASPSAQLALISAVAGDGHHRAEDWAITEPLLGKDPKGGGGARRTWGDPPPKKKPARAGNIRGAMSSRAPPQPLPACW